MLYNKRLSHFDKIKLAIKHLSVRGPRRWLIVIWIVLALCFVLLRRVSLW